MQSLPAVDPAEREATIRPASPLRCADSTGLHPRRLHHRRPHCGIRNVPSSRRARNPRPRFLARSPNPPSRRIPPFRPRALPRRHHDRERVSGADVHSRRFEQSPHPRRAMFATPRAYPTGHRLLAANCEIRRRLPTHSRRTPRQGPMASSHAPEPGSTEPVPPGGANQRQAPAGCPQARGIRHGPAAHPHQTSDPTQCVE